MIRWIIIIGNGLITICVGFALWSNNATIVANSIALVFSATVAAASAFESYYKHEQLYVRYKVGLAKVEAISRDLDMAEAKGSGNVPSDKLDSLWSSYGAVIAEPEDFWAEIRKRFPRSQREIPRFLSEPTAEADRGNI